MEKDLYKTTLNLPKTDFPMKGHLSKTEPQRVKLWQRRKIYEKVLEKNKNKNKFNLIDGPPYANGPIHLGHVLNKVLKDIIIKYKNLSGHYAPFIPFWDCHGLPIELKILNQVKSLENSKEQKQKIRELCKKEALKWKEVQSQEFQRLGVFAKWDEPCHTLDPEYEAEEIRILYKIHQRGLLQSGKKPVHWCPVLKTALASSEVAHKNHKSLSIYVKFYLQSKETQKNKPFIDSLFQKSSFEKISLALWTTTPWTLPANQAVAFHPDLEYELFEWNGEGIIMAKALLSNFQKTTQISPKSLPDPLVFKGKEFQGLKTKHPFLPQLSPVVLSDFVNLEIGTGIVHIAPGHGMDDYKLGLKHNLKVLSPIDSSGCYTKEIPEYEGESLWDVNPKIVERLKRSNHLLFEETIQHSYPYNPRTQTPLIFRSTPQWFIKIDDENYNLREKAFRSIEAVEFFPSWGKDRLKAMITNTPDWCLSRQRIWGVPIPILHCQKCGDPLVSEKIFHFVADLIEKTKKKGFEVYHLEPIEKILSGEKCSQCGNKDLNSFKREESILDVWFDSGVSHTALRRKSKAIDFPSDVYIEGSDQHRGWFQTSLFSALAYNGRPPYKKLITHGFVLDREGYKMSKSKGNVKDPSKLIHKLGADILRLWVIYEDYGQDIHVSEEIFQRVKETYRKFRNTLRFLLGNLYDFEPSKHKVEFKEMALLDQWILYKLNHLIEKSKAAYESYAFYKVYHLLNHFFTVELSSFYLDILKDRLYTWKKASRERRSSQNAFYHLLQSLVGLLSPVLSFLSEEVYEFIPGRKKESVFLDSFPDKNPLWTLSAESLEDLSFLFQLRSKAQKELEDYRKDQRIGSSLEARVSFSLEEKNFKRCMKFKDFLKEILIVSDIELSQVEKNEKIKIEKAKGRKCPRCWHYSEDIKAFKSNLICPKCIRALN